MKACNLFFALIVLPLFLIPEIGLTYDPPLDLKWGMSYDDFKSHVENKLEKDKRLKVSDLKDDKQLVEGFKRAELKDVKLLKRKAQDAYSVFDPDGNMCAIYYIFRWTDDGNGKDVVKCWEFHQNLLEALTSKYGTPTSDESENKRGERITTNIRYETVWLDEGNDGEIVVAFTRNLKKNILGSLDDYYVFLIYQNENGKRAEKGKAEAVEDL